MRAALTLVPPGPLAVGGGTVALLRGTVDPEGADLRGLSLTLGGGNPQPVQHLDGEWWVLFEVIASQALGSAPLVLIADDGSGPQELPLGHLELRRNVPGPRPEPPASRPGARGPRIAICMATYEPQRARLAAQIDSIRAQTHENWVCVISDDGSSPAAVAMIEDMIADDDRFVLVPAEENRGFYTNFERAMAMAPRDAALVQLADQDDFWHPDKLERMVAVLAANPGAILAYSDMRVVDPAGEVISKTFWYASDNAYEDIGTLLIVNTIFGVASLFRRELLDDVLPLPPPSCTEHYHDHWLALTARARGEIVFLDEPTYDYVRHRGSVTMSGNAAWAPPFRTISKRTLRRVQNITRRLRLALEPGVWRAAYFDRYLTIRQFALVLRLRMAAELTPAQRRSINLLESAERSPRALPWLVARTLHPLLGRRETMGRERVLIGALLWRRAATLRARRRII